MIVSITVSVIALIAIFGSLSWYILFYQKGDEVLVEEDGVA